MGPEAYNTYLGKKKKDAFWKKQSKKAITSGWNSNNSALGNLLLKEQKGYSAYTEHYLLLYGANAIENFNPNLKDKPEDHYYNWYKVKHLPNQRKTNS